MLFGLFRKPFLFFGNPFLPKELADPQRILITHFGGTADIVRSMPLLVALRYRFPHADIAWLIEEKTAPLVLDHWAVNRLIVVQHNWYKHLSEIRRVRCRLQSFAPHVAVDPQNSWSSSLAAWLSRATYRIGFGKKQSRRLHNVHIITDETHRIERNLQLLQPFGIFGCDIGFDLPEFEKDRLTAKNVLRRIGMPDDFVLLHISADTPSSRWHEERYASLAKNLYDQWNLPSLVTWTGDEAESHRAERVVLASGGAAALVQQTSLVDRRSLAKVATLFVGSDTAELQIAAAVGTTCIGLFGPTSAWENAPVGEEHRTIQVAGPEKRRHETFHEWMDALTVESVYEKCDEVLTTISQPASAPGKVMPIESWSVQKKVA